MSNHLLKCQVVFRKMRRIAPLRMLETGLEKMFLSLQASSCPACFVAECAVHKASQLKFVCIQENNPGSDDCA